MDATMQKNILEILQVLVKTAELQQNQLVTLEGQVAALSARSMDVVVKMPKPKRLRPFILGAVAGIYLYRQVAEMSFCYESKNPTKTEPADYTVKTDDVNPN